MFYLYMIKRVGSEHFVIPGTQLRHLNKIVSIHTYDFSDYYQRYSLSRLYQLMVSSQYGLPNVGSGQATGKNEIFPKDHNNGCVQLLKNWIKDQNKYNLQPYFTYQFEPNPIDHVIPVEQTILHEKGLI